MLQLYSKTTRLLPIILCACLAPVATASFDTGDLFGTVNDPSGKSLSGVKIVLQIGEDTPRDAVSDEDGLFRFRDLEPGNYVLHIQHEDYSKVTYEPVNVRLGRTTRVQVRLSPTLEETIVVTSEPPPDLLTTKAKVRWEESDLDRIPRGRDPFAVDAGGGGAVQERSANASASTSQALDGTVVEEGTPSAALGLAPLRGVEIRVGGSDVHTMTAGAVVDLLTRERSAGLRASVDGWRGELQGEEGAAADDQERVLDVGEAGAEAGGTVLRDRLWTWGSYRRQWVRRQVVGGGQEDIEQDAAAIELDAQVGGTSTSASYHRGGEARQGEGAGPDRGLETTRQFHEPSRLLKLEATHLFANAFRRADVQFIGTWLESRRQRRGVPLGDANADVVLGADGVWRGTFAELEEEEDTDLLQVEASFQRSRGPVRQEFRVGASLRDFGSERSERWGSRDLLQLAGENFGTPYDLLRVRRPVETLVERSHFAFWFQDSIRRPRLTVDLGFRHDLQRGRNAAGQVAASALFPELLPEFEFAGDATAMRWNTTLPRLGAARTFGREGRTVLRGSFGMFASPLRADLVRRTHPALAELALGFEDQDLDGLFDASEPFFRFIDRGFELRPTTDGPLRNQLGLDPERTDELRIALEHELRGSTLGVEFVRRRVSNLLETRRLVRLEDGALRFAQGSDYSLDQVLTGLLPDGSPYRVPVYSLRSGIEDTGGSVLLNGDRSQIWEAVTLRFDRRLARGFSLRAQVTWSDWRWQVGSLFRHYDDPTDAATGTSLGVSTADNDGDVVAPSTPTGQGFLNSRWSFDVFALYQLAPEKPWGFDVALNLHGRQGFPVPYELSALTVGNTLLSVQATPRTDSYRLDDLMTLDLHLEKGFRLGSTRLTLGMDALNLLDTEGDLERDQRLNSPQADAVRRTLSPRMFRFGLRLGFR